MRFQNLFRFDLYAQKPFYERKNHPMWENDQKWQIWEHFWNFTSQIMINNSNFQPIKIS